MIEPLQGDDVFLADVAAMRAQAGTGALHLWWVGQSGLMIVYEGRVLLMDPYLTDSLTEKYAATDKPHVRMSRRVVDPDRLDFVNVVTTSHDHTDHRDYWTLVSMLSSAKQPMVVGPAAHYESLQDGLNITSWEVVGVDDGTSASVEGFTFTGIAAAHERIERDRQGRCQCIGLVVAAGPWRIYHSGDTVLYDGLVDRLQPFSVDVTFLPINGRAPERRVAGNLNGVEAARLAKDIGAKLVVPCHYDMFEFNTADPREQFIPECERIGQPYRVLKLGERLTLTAATS